MQYDKKTGFGGYYQLGCLMPAVKLGDDMIIGAWAVISYN